jgi:hypothetical protein
VSRVEHDALLWELPRAEGIDDAPAPADSVLAAYRAGNLAAEQEARIEWTLAGSRQGRARLAELAGIRLELPAPRRRLRRSLAAATLAAAATLGIASLLFLGRGGPVLPEFDVRAEGLAAARALPGEARALADGRVRVRVEPRADGIPDLRFAVYRAEAEALIRLTEPDEIAIDVERGAALLTARAERLIGAGEGTRPFYVVVSARASLPRRVPVDVEGPEAALAAASKGRVYRVPLTIVPPPEGAP